MQNKLSVFSKKKQMSKAHRPRILLSDPINQMASTQKRVKHNEIEIRKKKTTQKEDQL